MPFQSLMVIKIKHRLRRRCDAAELAVLGHPWVSGFWFPAVDRDHTKGTACAITSLVRVVAGSHPKSSQRSSRHGEAEVGKAKGRSIAASDHP